MVVKAIFGNKIIGDNMKENRMEERALVLGLVLSLILYLLSGNVTFRNC
jgi:hypothetical protein